MRVRLTIVSCETIASGYSQTLEWCILALIFYYMLLYHYFNYTLCYPFERLIPL